jgi:aspartyl-tRNA(Asn)/glutamyl-tRNA(Gln) amidotransferase subunit A
MMDIDTLTIKQAAKLYQQRQLSPLELTNQFLQRIETLDPELNSFLTITGDLARQQADKADQKITKSTPSQILNGIPVAIKDLYQTRDIPTTAGSKIFMNFIPTVDSVVVTKLFQAGSVLLGKLNMHEVALGVTNVNPHYGACRNPWNPERISGGSSGGSAVALSASLCLGSCGSDTGGSIRIPASLCGIVGLKPTYGRVSLRGVIPLSWNLDHAGPMGRCVEDVAILLDCIAGYDPLDPASVDCPSGNYQATLKAEMKGWHIALADDEYFRQADTNVLTAVRSAAKTFESLGADVESVEFPGAREAAYNNGLMVVSDAATYHHQHLLDRPEDFGADVLERLRTGQAYRITEYIQSRHTQNLLRRQFATFFDKFDILISPTTPVTAPPIEGPDAVSQAAVLTRFTAPFNLTGLPAISLPCGFDSLNLPVGLQIISAPWQESKILQAAFAYETATEWKKRRPPV